MNNIETITCTYLGDALRPCCAPRVEGRSYCADHLWLVYQKGSNLRTRHKDIRTANTVWDIEQAFQEAVEELEAEGYDFALERWD
jgi:hypothetical protein